MKHQQFSNLRALSRNSGATLAEVAMVLAIAAILLVGGVALLSTWNTEEQEVSVKAWLADVEQALVAYALRHHRLPCIDADGDGFEDRDSSTGNCFTSDSVGGLPHATLERPPPSFGSEREIRYGVWRDTESDLTRRSIPTINDELQDPEGAVDFLRRVLRAAQRGSAPGQPFVAGVGPDGPRSTCTTNDIQSAAVVVVQKGPEPSGNCFSSTKDSALSSVGLFELLGLVFEKQKS